MISKLLSRLARSADDGCLFVVFGACIALDLGRKLRSG